MSNNGVNMDIPTLGEFLSFPVDKVRSIVPASLIFAAGGTRRGVALAGIPAEQYASWTIPRMLQSYKRFFDYGVQHLITPVTHPRMFQEKGAYGAHFIDWMEQGLGGAETLAYYRAANWSVRLIVAASSVASDPRIQRLRELARSLEQSTPETDTYLWYFVVPDYGDLWNWVIEKLPPKIPDGQVIQGAVIQALYGVDIPPADLLISFGKPTVSPDVLPPFLWGLVHAYWTQQPSYLLDDEEIRRIFYDYYYHRNTFRIDKTGREKEALTHPALWTHGPTVGMGIRVGPYWYPEPFSLPDDDISHDE